jgi:hypothetical protein
MTAYGQVMCVVVATSASERTEKKDFFTFFVLIQEFIITFVPNNFKP